VVKLQSTNGLERRREEKDKRKGFAFLKSHQTYEFIYKFEFKHTKMMHQRECNKHQAINLI
jgi:hypothetical protein